MKTMNKPNTSWKRVDSEEIITYNPTTDYFSEYDLLPANIYEILMNMQELQDYEDTKKLLIDLESEGWTFDYGLDNVPYGLRPIGTNYSFFEDGLFSQPSIIISEIRTLS